MFLKKYKQILLWFLFLIVFCCIFLLLLKFFTKTPVIHIFYESVGSSPIVAEASVLVQLPKEDIKIIGWHRVRIPSELFKQDSHVHVIPIIGRESDYRLKDHQFLSDLIPILARYEGYPIVVHTNMLSNGFMSLFLKLFKKDRSLTFHLYEDGFFNILIGARLSSYVLSGEDIKKLEDFLAGKTDIFSGHTFPIQLFYPTFFHIAGLPEILKQQNRQEQLRFFSAGQGTVVDFDVEKIKLTTLEKRKLAALFNLDYSDLKKLFSKNIILFASGHVHRNFRSKWKQTPENWLRLLQAARDGKFGVLPSDAQWVVKQHPSQGVFDMSSILKESFPDMIEISKDVPYEIFSLLGLKPSLYFVSGSSFVFWLKKERFLKYISHPLYDLGLRESHIISDKIKIYPHLLYDFEQDRAMVEASFKLIYNNQPTSLVREFSENRYCVFRNPYRCGSWHLISSDKAVMEWDDQKKETFSTNDGISWQYVQG